MSLASTHSPHIAMIDDLGIQTAEGSPVSPPKTVIARFPKPETSRVSHMSATLIGSEILKIAADIRSMLAEGSTVCNLTVGDFNPHYFPIPQELQQEITRALDNKETNYPPSDGVLLLRQAVKQFYEEELGLVYPLESFLVTGGARPAIYGTYRALLDPGDTVVYPVPSWNNNHYAHLTGARGIAVPCNVEDSFLPTRESFSGGVLRDARLLAICSPLNPTGTAFTHSALEGICDLVLEENERRKKIEQKPLFLAYDQVYWMLTFGETQHHNPVTIRPELAPYTIFIDGISKAFAATGVRVGWAVAPPDVAHKMSNILGHVGAWAPRAEQIATAKLLVDPSAIAQYHTQMISRVEERLDALYNGITALREEGCPVDAISPMGAIYLTARFNFLGRHTPKGELLDTNEAIRKYLLHEAHLAIIPFQAFGAKDESGWFRLSVGAVSLEEIDVMLPKLRAAIDRLE